MTIYLLSIYVAVAAILLTVFMKFFLKKESNPIISFLQNFTGILFIVSGYVKVVDPLGLSYKMSDYYAELEPTFAGSGMSFLAPIFPWLNQFSNGFAVGMIVLEIVIGIMLILGAYRKLTAWLFLGLIVIFTFLTGYTHLSGYVPQGVNFFEFSKWDSFVETNMKVTDCGCFGEFMKLKPIETFTKDLFLLIPGFIFIFFHKKMHQLWTPTKRTIAVSLSIVGLTLFAFYNYKWNIPVVDFRPFKIGVDIAKQKKLETEATENVKIIAYKMTNKTTDKVVEVPYEQYMKEYKKYPKEDWKIEQIKTEPTVKHTKISDFDISDSEGNDVTEELLENNKYKFLIIAYKMKYETEEITKTIKDTTYVYDTIMIGNKQRIIKGVDGIMEKEISREINTFDKDYVKAWRDYVNPEMVKAEKAGVEIYAITQYADDALIDDFRHETQSAYPFLFADDILLKTIVRSNPGILLLKGSTIIKKWHYKRLPAFEEIQKEFLH